MRIHFMPDLNIIRSNMMISDPNRAESLICTLREEMKRQGIES